LLAILILLLTRSCAPSPAPPAPAPTAAATQAPPATAAAPTVAAPLAPKLNLPAAPDFGADGVALSGSGQPGSTVEIWDGETKIGTAKVGADGLWKLDAKLGEGAHQLAVRAVDDAGRTINEAAGLDVTVPKREIALPKLNPPAAADFTSAGVQLSGTGQPNATIEIWDAKTKVGTAMVGPDGQWSLTVPLEAGSHKMIVRTLDADGRTLNEAPAVGVNVPAATTPAPSATPTPAPSATPKPAAAGQVYIVKAGDWLSKLAQEFYGDAVLYPRIVEGTNAKAAIDPSFARIRDPNLIEIGQKLWIPPKPAG